MASAAEMGSHSDVILERGFENYLSTVLVVYTFLFALCF
jgi:hypothetical protein